MSGGINDNDRLNILINDYNNCNSNYEKILEQYRSQVTLLSTYLTVSGTILGVIASGWFKPSSSPTSPVTVTHSAVAAPLSLGSLCVACCAVSAVIAVFIVLHVMDVLYHLFLTESRGSATEERINQMAGSKLLNWDSEALPAYNDIGHFGKSGWINSSYLSAVGFFVLMATLVLIHIAFCIYTFPNALSQAVFSSILVFVVASILHQLYLLNAVGRIYLYAETRRIVVGSYPAGYQGAKFSENIAPVAGIATFCFGFLPIVILSYADGTLTPRPTGGADIPLVTVASVVIGDSLILPYINYMICMLALRLWGLGLLRKPQTLLWVVLSFLVSSIANYFVHLAWVSDKFTDHISRAGGRLSVGGFWHLGFSTIQTTLFLCLPGLWILAALNHSLENQRLASKIFAWGIVFALLMPVNFIYQYFYVFGRPGILAGLLLAKFTFVPLLVALIGFSVVRVFRR